MNAGSLRPEIRGIQTISADLGSIGVLEGNYPIPFDIKRIYFIHSVPSGSERGAHGHKTLSQFIFVPHGRVDIELDNGIDKKTFVMNSATQGLFVPPGLWRNLNNFSDDAVCVVAASEIYLESDYIRDYNEFLEWTASHERTLL